jgi:hypothetical protein
MYDCFINNWKNEYIDSDNIKAMFTTVQNGITPIKWLLKNTSNSKLLLMERDGIGFSYALANRRALRSGNFYSHLYDFAIINLWKDFHRFIHSPEIQSDKKVLIVDFNDLVLNTSITMKRVSDFIGVEYEDILCKATLNGVSLESKEVRFTGKMNEDPHKSLSLKEINFLEYLYYNRSSKNKKTKIFYFAVRALKYKVGWSLSKLIAILKFFLNIFKEKWHN